MSKPSLKTPKRPEAVDELFSKALAIAANGSTIIAWPKNNHITAYIQQLENELNAVKQERFWPCEHMRPSESGRFLCAVDAVQSQIHYLTGRWHFCPICGAKRPK